MHRRTWRRLLLLAIASGVLTGCADAGSNANKAGGLVSPVTLRLATVDPQGRPDSPMVERFASAVADLSAGRLQIDIAWQAEPEAAEFEQAIIERVGKREFDLGWVGSRAWDRAGVTGLEPLQTPFLVTDYSLLHDVLKDPVAGEMLAGLDAAGFVGLGLYPGLLRHPASLGAPIVSLADFKGARFRVASSKVSDQLVRALGAEPVHVNGLAASEAIEHGDIDVLESSLAFAPVPVVGVQVTGNITFYPGTLTLFANAASLSALTDDGRRILRDAAARTLGFALDTLPASDDGATLCAAGDSVVAAAPGDVAAIMAKGASVRDTLRKDSGVGRSIDRIEAIKGSRPAPPTPATCSGSPAGSPSPAASASLADPLLEGTWETPRLTREVMRRALTSAGLDPTDVVAIAINEGFSDYMVYQVEIADGQWTIYGFPDGRPTGIGWAGTYDIPQLGTAVATEEGCGTTYHYKVTDSELRTEIAAESCGQAHNMFQVVIYESAPFTRVK